MQLLTSHNNNWMLNIYIYHIFNHNFKHNKNLVLIAESQISHYMISAILPPLEKVNLNPNANFKSHVVYTHL